MTGNSRGQTDAHATAPARHPARVAQASSLHDAYARRPATAPGQTGARLMSAPAAPPFWSTRPPREPTYPAQSTLPANSFPTIRLNCWTRVDLKFCSTAMTAPLGFTGSIATGGGRPFDRNTDGVLPMVPLLITGPYEAT